MILIKRKASDRIISEFEKIAPGYEQFTKKDCCGIRPFFIHEGTHFSLGELPKFHKIDV